MLQRVFIGVGFWLKLFGWSHDGIKGERERGSERASNSRQESWQSFLVEALEKLEVRPSKALQMKLLRSNWNFPLLIDFKVGNQIEKFEQKTNKKVFV